jgi:hypothetical protein
MTVDVRKIADARMPLISLLYIISAATPATTIAIMLPPTTLPAPAVTTGGMALVGLPGRFEAVVMGTLVTVGL